jgi:hypothetical protein
MLPFDRKPWARKVAGAVIVLSIAAVVFSLLYLREQGPLDTGEFWVAGLFLFAALPPNIAILFRRRQVFDVRKPPLRVAL